MTSFTINEPDPIRCWENEDGEEIVAAAPHVLAVYDELKREGTAKPSLEQVRLRWNEYAGGDREMDESTFAAMVQVDERQREHGYNGAPLIQTGGPDD